MVQESMIHPQPISFGERLASSQSFKALFKDGMALVEETAAYLDGAGRDDAKRLPRTAALAYASESMRLTTRLMQIASWLLLQRAVNEGEMTQAEAGSDKRRTRMSWQQATGAPEARLLLPGRLNELVDNSLRMQERIMVLDGLISGPSPTAPRPAPPRALEQQMSLLRDAFGV